MAAVTGPQYTFAPPPREKRRPWLIGLTMAWIVVVAGLGWWSVRRDPATVPEQRDIVAAVADVRATAGVVFAAADGDGRAVVVGGFELDRDCRITPVRGGLSAARNVTVYVRDGAAREALEAVAARLPRGYRAQVAVSRGGTRLALHADAGEFVGIDADAESTAGLFTLRITTGCRPAGTGDPGRADPAAGPVPTSLGAVLAGLGAGVPAGGAAGAGDPGGAVVEAVACPGGGVAATYTVDDVAAPADMAARLRAVSAGAAAVRADDSVWAYRTGGDSVVVLSSGKSLRVSVSTGC